MCGRGDIPSSNRAMSELNIKWTGAVVPEQRNVPPTYQVPLVFDKLPDELNYARWSLIPWHAKEFKEIRSKTGKRLSTFNAKIENLDRSPLWSPLRNKKHCIILIEAFYEWKTEDGKKQPYRITLTDGSLIRVAGFWDGWHDKEKDEVLYSCTMVVKPPNEFMQSIHDRMPGILTGSQPDLWLDHDVAWPEKKSMIEQEVDSSIFSVEAVTL